mmetsp:Transcript_95582/g.160525  ORF Transcript_95582/g.160525 Transcript_95582/m.160525 type:complete len:363 (+) Transcript_95582:364-1452(+)
MRGRVHGDRDGCQSRSQAVEEQPGKHGIRQRDHVQHLVQRQTGQVFPEVPDSRGVRIRGPDPQLRREGVPRGLALLREFGGGVPLEVEVAKERARVVQLLFQILRGLVHEAQDPGNPRGRMGTRIFAQGFCVREDRQLRPPIKYVEWTKDFARSTASCRISRFDPQRGEQGVTTTPQIIGASIIATLGSSPSTDERSVGHAAVAGTTASRPGKAFSGPRMPSQAPTPVHSCTACPAKAPDATLVLWWWGQASPHDTLRPRHWLPMSWPTGGLQLCLHLLVRDPDRVLLECRGRSPQSYALDMHGSFGVTGWCRVLQLWLFYDVLDNIMWKGNQERQHGGLTAHNLLSGEAWGSGQCRMCPGV